MNKAFLIFGGVFNILMVVLHTAFWKIFDWPASLASISPDNRSVLQVINIHLILVFAAFAYASLFHRQELISSKIGRAILGVIALFYFLRVINEFIFWGISGIESIVIVFLCLIVGVAYAVPLLSPRSQAG